MDWKRNNKRTSFLQIALQLAIQQSKDKTDNFYSASRKKIKIDERKGTMPIVWRSQELIIPHHLCAWKHSSKSWIFPLHLYRVDKKFLFRSADDSIYILFFGLVLIIFSEFFCALSIWETISNESKLSRLSTEAALRSSIMDSPL